MKRLPGAVFIVDPHRERIAVTEANRLEIPVVGTGDTNVDPDELDYIIPANDDAIRAIRLLCSLVADAAIEGAQERASRAIEPEVEPTEEPTYDDVGATDELVAALAGGAALSFAPDEEDDLLPGRPGGAARRTCRRRWRNARRDRGGARSRGGREGATETRRPPNPSTTLASQRATCPPSTNRSTGTRWPRSRPTR